MTIATVAMVIFATMNSRDYKMFRQGGYYHVYNRGDNKENIFLDEQDYFNFLKRLKIVLGLLSQKGGRGALRIRPLPKDSFTVLCYCLMPNHFHIIIRQNGNIPVGQCVTKITTSYAKYFNAKYNRVGNLFQDTFKSKLVDSDSYLTYLSAYVHNNPAEPLVFPYSSFHDYLGLRQGTICDTGFILKYFKGDREAYKKFVLGYGEKESQLIKHLVFED